MQDRDDIKVSFGFERVKKYNFWETLKVDFARTLAPFGLRTPLIHPPDYSIIVNTLLIVGSSSFSQHGWIVRVFRYLNRVQLDERV